MPGGVPEYTMLKLDFVPELLPLLTTTVSGGATFPSAGILDTFNRADGALGST